MLTDRGTALIASGVALWVASRTFGIPELQMAAVGALVLVGIALGLTAVSSAELSVQRTVRPLRLFPGERGEVELVVMNTGRLPTARIELHDRAPATITDGGNRTLPPLPPGSRVSVTYQLRGDQRGRFELGPLTVRLRDPFGLAARERTLGPTAEVVVYPTVWPLPAGIPIAGSTTSGGAARPSPLATGEHLADVREYVQGDDLRAVHWPTTAHRGRLMVRRTESPHQPRATVLLDVRSSRHTGHGPTASIETVVTAAASAVHHLAGRGRSVVLVDRPLSASPDTLPWQRWLERLAELTTEEVDHRGVLRQIAQGVAGDGTLVAIVTVPETEELRALVRAGRGFSTRVALLVDTARTNAGAGRAAATVDALRVAGWRAVVLSPGDRLEARWQDLILHRRSRVGAS